MTTSLALARARRHHVQHVRQLHERLRRGPQYTPVYQYTIVYYSRLQYTQYIIVDYSIPTSIPSRLQYTQGPHRVYPQYTLVDQYITQYIIMYYLSTQYITQYITQCIMLYIVHQYIYIYIYIYRQIDIIVYYSIV